MNRRFGVGIVGLQPERGWAMSAHVPALRALSSDFDIVGVANRSKSSAAKAAAAAGIPKAFADVSELVASPDIDIVTVTVRVPHHKEIATAAIEAGKHVYCEWPLGNGLAEAEEMAALARARGVLGVVGTQAPFAPEIQYAKKLIADGFVGEVLSIAIVARGGALQGGGSIPDSKAYGYLLDRTNGATMLTIPVGHTLAALTSMLGEIAEVSGVVATRRAEALVIDRGEWWPVTSPDEVLISGTMASGAPLSIHYRGGASRDDDGLFFEIHGTEGDIRISGPSGHTQMVQLSLSGARDGEKRFQPLEVPETWRSGWPQNPASGNVARVYASMARDLRHGTRSAPTFDEAVGLHRLTAAIEAAAETGMRMQLVRDKLAASAA
jgi:predicted dehydrogenase